MHGRVPLAVLVCARVCNSVVVRACPGVAQHLHFSAEGEIAFKSILYIPKQAPSDLYDKVCLAAGWRGSD